MRISISPFIKSLKHPPSKPIPMESDGRPAVGGGDWAEVTPVCLVDVLQRLPPEDLWRGAARVCRSWWEASRDSSLYETLDLDASFDEAAGGAHSEAPFWWTPAFVRRIDSMVRATAERGGGNLRKLRVRHCSDLSLAFVAERCPNLEVLSIKNSPNINDGSLDTIASSCPLLRELDISNCYEVSYRSLERIGNRCPNLTVLKRNFLNWLDPSEHSGTVPADYLNMCPQDGDREAATISKSMPNLRHLELRFSRLTSVGLSALSQGCSNLDYLDLVGCANLTGRAIDQASANLKAMQTLKKPNFYIPRSAFHTERYGHWRLYDERFQTNVFQL